MPPIEGAPPPETVQGILRKLHADLLLLITHKHDGQYLCFVAVHHPGGWCDLSGQAIRITERED